MNIMPYLQLPAEGLPVYARVLPPIFSRLKTGQCPVQSVATEFCSLLVFVTWVHVRLCRGCAADAAAQLHFSISGFNSIQIPSEGSVTSKYKIYSRFPPTMLA